LWKRHGITLQLFDDYWKDVHGPVCARLPGQFQYWQFHVAHNQSGIWPTIEGIEYVTADEDQFDGIAELTFNSVQERQTWFEAAAILMDDEHNIFRKAIGYTTKQGNSKTYVDRIEVGDPNGSAGADKFHVLVKRADAVSVEDFRAHMVSTVAPAFALSDLVVKFRLHLFDEVDNSRPDAAGVSHYEPPQKQFDAAFEVAFKDRLDLERFFASTNYIKAMSDHAAFVRQISPFPERNVYTFVYNGAMTLAGQRSSMIAALITDVGAVNQLRDDVLDLMLGKGVR
jgi:hypothetical protein